MIQAQPELDGMYPQALTLDPASLRPNPWNSNHCSPDNEAKLEQSIRRRGMFKPVVVRETAEGFEILGGQHRSEVSARIGLSEIPVFNLGPLDDKAAKEIGLLDNARYGADDVMGLQAILSSIGNAADLATFLPYSDTELGDILVIDDSALDDLSIAEDLTSASETLDEAPEPSKAPKTHQVMRFKVANLDAERIALLIADVQKRHGYTLADEMTNAGDALVHLLLSGAASTVKID